MSDVQRAQARNVAAAFAFAAAGMQGALMFMLGWYVALTMYAMIAMARELA